jgi:hypothetical protein
LWIDAKYDLREIVYRQNMMLMMGSKIIKYSEVQDQGASEGCMDQKLNCFGVLTGDCNKCCMLTMLLKKVITSKKRNHTEVKCQRGNNQQQVKVKILELVRKISKRKITNNELLINDGRGNKEITLQQRKVWDLGRLQTLKMQ